MNWLPLYIAFKATNGEIGIEPRYVRKFIVWALKLFTEGLSASGLKEG